MKSLSRKSLVAALIAASFTAQADEILVTAKRFNQPGARAATHVSVITRDDIAASPATNLPDLFKQSAGIDVRMINGGHGIDATIDLRGFGETATGNTLILVDGQRFNPIDSSAVAWPAIPLASIERIEILRGQGTVLYGDGATAGVINIITRKAGPAAASVSASLGSFQSRGLEAQISGVDDKRYFRLFAQHAASEGWRRNGQADQDALSGRVGLFDAGRDTFIDYSLYRFSNGLPGALYADQYRNDPRAARFPLDNQRRWGYRVRPGAVFMLSDALSLEAEVAVEHDELAGDYPSFAGQSIRKRDTISFTPRLAWRHGVFALPSETVFGGDFYRGDVWANYSTSTSQSALQESEALYVHNTTTLAPRWTLNLGGRAQRMTQRADQDAYTSAWMGPVPAFSGESQRLRRAFELGLAHQGEGFRAYAKTGTTFRFANTDELYGQDPNTWLPVFAGDIRPQHGRVKELGASLGGGAWSARASLYEIRLVDEIGYDSLNFVNTNFDPTRRRGFELEGDWRVLPTLDARLAYSRIDARFESGTNAGKDVPMVPGEILSAQLQWRPQAGQRYTLAAKHTGARRIIGDAGNIETALPGYDTLDFAAGWDVRSLQLSLRANNLLDKRYATSGGVTGQGYYYYPADARSIVFSVRHDFK